MEDMYRAVMIKVQHDARGSAHPISDGLYRRLLRQYPAELRGGALLADVVAPTLKELLKANAI